MSVHRSVLWNKQWVGILQKWLSSIVIIVLRTTHGRIMGIYGKKMKKVLHLRYIGTRVCTIICWLLWIYKHVRMCSYVCKYTPLHTHIMILMCLYVQFDVQYHSNKTVHIAHCCKHAVHTKRFKWHSLNTMYNDLNPCINYL